MQTAIISTSTDNLPSSAKSVNANNPPPITSFDQVLNKEISQQNNQNTQATQTSQNTQSTQNTINNQNNKQSQNVSKPNTPDQPTPTAQTNNATNDTKSVKDTSKTKQTTQDQADTADKASTSDASNNAQLIALVGNIGQLATDPKKLDASSKDDTKSLTAASPALSLTDKDISTTEAAKALLAQTNAANVTTTGKDTATIDADTAPSKVITAASDAIGKINAGKELQPDDKASASTTSKDAKQAGGLTADTTNALAGDKSQKSAMPQAIEAIEGSAGVKTAALDKLQDAAQAATPTTQSFAQQLAVSSNQAANAPGVEHLAPRVGTPAWDQAVGQKVVWMVAGGQQTAELTLNPPDLGPLKVVLSVNNDQANATFTSANPDVRDALESALPKLRQMMSDAGVQLSGFSVGTQSSQQGNTPQDSRSGSRSSSAQTSSTDTTIAGVTSSTGKVISKIGMVDTFA